jgi:hypothetical protein
MPSSPTRPVDETISSKYGTSNSHMMMDPSELARIAASAFRKPQPSWPDSAVYELPT